MKKMNKLLCCALSSFMLTGCVLGTTSCGKSSDKVDFGNTEVEVVAYDGSEVTVTFYHTMGATLKGVLDKHIAKFNELYPNITIEHKSQGDYPGVRDQITTEINSGKSPTMAYCYSDHVALYNKAKATVSLDGYIACTDTVTNEKGETETMGLTAAQKADYVKAYYDEGAAYGDGKMYTLPFIKSTEVLYYNKTYFEAKGYEVPTTWTEMEALCAAIETAEPQNTPLGYDSEANWFITMCEQYGTPYTSATGDHFLFNTEKNWEFVEMLKNWYDKGYVTTEATNGGYTSDLFTQTDPAKRKTYMTIGSSAGASYQCPDKVEGTGDEYPFEVGIASIPQVDPNNPKVISQGPSVCLFKKNDPQEVAAAWLFAKYLTTSIAFQAEFSMVSGYTPVIQSVEQNETYKTFLDSAMNGNTFINDFIQASCVKQSVAQKDACFVSPAFIGSSGARDEVGILMENVFENSPSSGQSLRDFVKYYFNEAIDTLDYYYGN